MLSRRELLLSAAAGFPLATSGMATAAQRFGDGRPVTIIVPFAPGGGSDVLARLLSFPLADALKVPVIVENRPGAGGLLATRDVKGATPDGTRLLIADIGFSASASLYREARYNPTRDFAAIASLASVASILTVRAASPYGSLAGLVAAAKQRSGAITMASGGIGGSAHLIGAMFASQAGFVPTHVPYRGMGPAMTGIIAGEADFIVATAPVAMPFIQDHRAGALAVASAKRVGLLPEIATFAEQAYPGVVADDVYGIVGPVGLPAEMVMVLHREITAIARTASFTQRLMPLGMTGLPMDSPQAYAAFLRDDFTKWRDVIERNNIGG
jgi:tripartite-type tricarboxylate transporter receptor subunit TctC